MGNTIATLRASCWILFAAAGVGTASCTFYAGGAEPRAADKGDTPASIQEFAAGYAAAFVAGDPEQVGAMFTDDFVAMAPEAPPLEGRDQAMRYIAKDLGRMKVGWLEFAVTEAREADDWAWVRGTCKGEMVLAGVRHIMPLEGKFLWILERQPNGAWLMAVDASSASKPHKHGPAPDNPSTGGS